MSGIINHAIIEPPRITPMELFEQWMKQIPRQLTRDSYIISWKFFCISNGDMPLELAVDEFLTNGPVNAYAMCANMLDYMNGRGSSNNTKNTRMAAIMSLLSHARNQSLVLWDINLKRAKVENRRVTRGPTREKVNELFAKMEAKKTECGVRDLAMARLLYNPALRSFEVLELDLEHVDIKEGRVNIRGKSRGSREWFTIPLKTCEALDHWLAIRPNVESKAVFVTLNHQSDFGRRVPKRRLYEIMRGFGVRPHGMRHSSITTALDATNGNIRAVQKFARHSTPMQVLAYDDDRRDLGGQVAHLIDLDDAEMNKTTSEISSVPWCDVQAPSSEHPAKGRPSGPSR